MTIMKKIFNSLFVVIAAMGTFAGCQKSEITTPANEVKSVEFFAESIETKTHFGDKTDQNKYPTLWSGQETIKILVNLKDEATSGTVEVSSDNTSAKFTTEVELKNAVAPYVFYAISPSGAYLGMNAERFSVTIPTLQTPQENSVDEAAQILYSVSDSYTEMPSTVPMNFHHFTAYGKLSFTNLELGDAVVESVAITSSIDFADRWNYMIADGSFAENSGASSITLNTDKTQNIWFACAPVGSMNGQSLTFTVNTDKGPISKTVELSGDNYKFDAGKVAVMTVDMTGKTFAKSDVYELVLNPAELTVGSKIIIVANDDEFALSTTQNTNNRGQAAVSKVNGVIKDPGAGVQVMTIENGTQAGTVAFNVGNGYLYAASSSSNHLKTETAISDNSSWIVTIADGVATIQAQGSNSRNIMQYNQTSSLFACYGSASQKALSIYKIQDSGSVPENYLNVSTTAIEVAADATTASFTVSSNLDWTATSDDAQVTVNGDVVNVTFEANMEEADQTYVVTVSANGVDSKTVTITQKAWVDASDISRTVAEFNALEDGDTVYELTGVITGFYENYNSQFNNVAFYINDGTGEVLIYRMSCTGVADPATSITLGDEITVQGTKTTYGGSPQMASGGKYISHRDACQAPEMSFEDNTVSITSESGAKIYYTTDGSVPSESSSLYNGPIPVDEGQTITVKAIAVKSGLLTSVAVTKEFTGVSADAPTTTTISMTFSSYSAGTQYAANEAHRINDVLTLYTTECHFTSELRIYSSSTHNGYVESNKLPGRITQMTFNAGNKVDVLEIYGKTDATSWTKVGEVSVTSTSYKDYTFNFGNTNYTYFKIDVKGANQVRLKTMSVTYEN